MTEQEKREKAIEELRPIIKKGSSSCGTCARWLSFENNFFLERLADYFIRKEEEVQKEKAKEIYKAVLDLRELMVNNDDALCILRNVESWAKEDGVEVEE